MSKWKVALYMPFGVVWASIDEVYGGEIQYFDTLAQAEEYGKSKSVPFEPVEVRATAEIKRGR